jgi:hypothetical protein
MTMSETKALKAKRPSRAAVVQDAAKTITVEAVAPPEPAAAVAMPAPVVAPQPLPRRPQGTADDLLAGYRGTMVAIGESQRAIASGVRALALEMSGLTRANLTAASESATALLGARNFADAVEIQIGFARRSLDAMVAGGMRLSEIGARLASEASRPIVAPLTGSGHND